MIDDVEDLTKKVFDSDAKNILALGRFGIEKESLRVSQSTISTKPHQESMGSPLCHGHITTDFSEAQLELITPPLIDKKTGWRTKFRSKNYEKVKHLKGNSPKMQYHYYHLRQQGLVKSFLQYYPEYKKLFFDMRANLHDWSNQLYKNYRECFINKQKPLKNYPYNFKTHMYALHELYLYDLKSMGQYINKNEIIKYVNNLPPPRLMYAVNYNLRKYGQREAVVNQLT